MTTLRFGNLRILHKLVICFAVIIAAALTSSAWIYQQRDTLTEADHWTDHTYQVIDQLNGALEGILNQQSGLRGYLLTMSSTPLNSYHAGRRQFSEHLDALKQITSDNAEQQHRLTDIEQAVATWNAQIAEPAIALMAADAGRPQAQDLERNAIGRGTFPAIRAKALEIENAERSLLRMREVTKLEARSQITVAIVSAGIVMTILAIVSVMLLGSSIAAPLARMTEAMERLAAGQLGTQVPVVSRRDEIGKLSSAFVAFKASLTEAEALRDEQARQEQRAAERRKADMHQLADLFEKNVGNIVKVVSSASTELESAAATLTRTADTTQQLAGQVASASEEASSNVQSVATAAEEMTTAVNEISRQAQDSR
ncbi:MAG TPA: CHASE3 domain-containing protein, partial [Pseudolabrys sp.]|nr:CHASE3 domain-containing protein [Pseudolabrys sp.]